MHHHGLVVQFGPFTADLRTGELWIADRLAAAEALSAYACVLKTQGRFQDGLAVIQRAHALAPESARITAEVGFHLHAAGRYEDEFPMLRRAIEQDPRSPDAWLHLGLAYGRRAEFSRAVETLTHASTLAHGDARVHEWLAWARAQEGAASTSGS